MSMNDNIIEKINIFFQSILKGVLFGILPILIFMLITSKTPIIFGIRSFVVLSGSMQPTLPVGSIIFTKDIPSYRVGEMITFQNGSVPVTHRIIDTQMKDTLINYKTQGDANSDPDGQLVSKNEIIGKVFYHIPYIGKITSLLKTLPGFLIFIVLPALIFIIFEIINIKKELTREIEKKLLQKINPI